MTGDLVERLRSALQAAEDVARAATAGPWAHNRGVIEAPEKAREVRLQVGVTSVDRWYVVCDSSTGEAVGRDDGAFIAANDPAHVLRTIQAHRKIIDTYVGLTVGSPGVLDSEHADVGRLRGVAAGLKLAIEDLAAIYLPDIESGDTPNG